KVRHRLTDHQGEVGHLAFAPDGRVLAVCHNERLRLWDVTTGREQAPLEANRYCYMVAFAPDGRTLAAADNGSVRLWRHGTGKKVGELHVIPDKVESELTSLAFSPDGRMLVLGLWNQNYTERSLEFWEVASARRRFRISQPGGP